MSSQQTQQYPSPFSTEEGAEATTPSSFELFELFCNIAECKEPFLLEEERVTAGMMTMGWYG